MSDDYQDRMCKPPSSIIACQFLYAVSFMFGLERSRQTSRVCVCVLLGALNNEGKEEKKKMFSKFGVDGVFQSKIPLFFRLLFPSVLYCMLDKARGLLCILLHSVGLSERFGRFL